MRNLPSGFSHATIIAAVRAAVMTVNRIIVLSGFCITALAAALAGDCAAVSVSVAAAVAQAVGV
jgi:hypothetical protein